MVRGEGGGGEFSLHAPPYLVGFWTVIVVGGDVVIFRIDHVSNITINMLLYHHFEVFVSFQYMVFFIA
jgi:hypothetical protein